MTNKSMRVSTRFLLMSLILAYSVAPFVSRAISTYLTTYAYMLIVVWTLFVIICAKGLTSVNEYLSILLPFILYQALTFITRTNSIIYWGYGVLLFVLPITVAYYILHERQQYVAGLSKWLIILFVITALTTIIGLISYPQASRVLATDISKDSDTVLQYNWNNIGGYGFVYTLVLLYPLVILAFKQKKLPLIYTVIIAVTIGTVIILSEYTTALLLFIISSVLFLLRRELTVKGMIIFSVCGIVAVIVFSNLMSSFLMWLANQFDSAFMNERLTSLAGGKIGLEGSESNRIFLYRYSFNTFLSNPIFGTMFNGGGGSGSHSQTLDTLAVYGIVGGALMVWMYRYIYVLFLKPFKQKKGFGYIVWFFAQAIFLSTVNTSFWFEILALYGPLILYSIYHKNEETQEIAS